MPLCSCVHVNNFLNLSDMRNGHGVWNVLTVSSLTRREWCHHPWGPVNAAVLRAWRHGLGALHTVVTLTLIDQAYNTGTLLTRWETLHTVTGGKYSLCGWYSTRFVVNILRSFLSLLVLSQPREASQGTLRENGKWHTAGMMMRYAKVGKSEKQCLFQWELQQL